MSGNVGRLLMVKEEFITNICKKTNHDVLCLQKHRVHDVLVEQIKKFGQMFEHPGDPGDLAAEPCYGTQEKIHREKKSFSSHISLTCHTYIK